MELVVAAFDLLSDFAVSLMGCCGLLDEWLNADDAQLLVLIGLIDDIHRLL